jgi:DNA-binding NtrC family response regulator
MQTQQHSYSVKSWPNTATPQANQGLVFIYSADRDLADSMMMLLEDRYTIMVEMDSRNIIDKVQAVKPSLVIVDLPSAPVESLKITALLKKLPDTLPIVLFRSYRGNLVLEQAIQTLNAFVFFKPFDIDQLSELMFSLLTKGHNTTNGGADGTAAGE